VDVNESEVAALAARGYLPEEVRGDPAAIKAAIEGVISEPLLLGHRRLLELLRVTPVLWVAVLQPKDRCGDVRRHMLGVRRVHWMRAAAPDTPIPVGWALVQQPADQRQ
jgi:hypothetical protein